MNPREHAQVCGAFVSSSEDTSVAFDDALRGFTALNGWEARIA
jgi:hypothetical protein